MNEVAMILGYILIAVILIGIGFVACQYLEAAYWYHSRFNSGNISKLRDVIHDAELRIEQLKNK